MKISYSILTHNEDESLLKLIEFLVKHKDEEDEIVILDDYSDNEKTKEILDTMCSIHEIKFEQRKLLKDYAGQKNYLKNMCSGDYIFNLDADELPHKQLIKNIKPILESNTTIDLYWIPRVNTVDGLTQEHINKWRWKVNEKGWVNWPDYQGRIWRNRPNIMWKNPVHEVLTGYKEYAFLPAEEEYCFYHPKEIDRQEKQNQFYDSINSEEQIKYESINLDYFLGMELASGGGGKEIIKQNNTLTTVGDIVKFFSIEENRKKVKSNLNPKNWQYFNCMFAEFKKDVADHHEIGWENLTEEYFNSLDDMDENEIQKMLKENPVEFQNGFIKHSYHRAVAMIGRLISGKSYIPFYMKESQIYAEPTLHDGIHRVIQPVRYLKGLSDLDEMGIDRSQYTLTQSSILTLMGIRQNDDLDIIVSSQLRNRLNKNNENFSIIQDVDVFPKDYDKFKAFKCQGDDDAINNYSINIFGYNFLEPRFYFSRKHKDKTQRDINDWIAINRFFDNKCYEGYPFNKITKKQWGLELEK